MATGNVTLLDIAKRNASDEVVGLIDETSKATPEVRMGAARTISGTQYKTRVRTGLPSGDFFRNANEGAEAGKSEIENRLVETMIFNPNWQCDKAVADASEDGREAYILEEAEGVMSAAMQNVGSQFYYGTGNSAKGFPGLLAAVDSDMEYNASGDSNKTSVWGVRWGRRDTQLVVGEEGGFKLDPVTTTRLEDDDGNHFTAYIQEMLTWLGLQVGSKYSIGRIKNVEDDTNTLDDDMLAELVDLWPAGQQPDVIYMNGRSHKQLKKSRTATNATGAPAPWPQNVQGKYGQIPIQVTDSITNSE